MHDDAPPERPGHRPTARSLLASDSCEALQSIQKRTNAGKIRLVPGQTYAVIGKNRAQDATHYLLQIEAARPSQRWVSVDCGQLEGGAIAEPALPNPALPNPALPKPDPSAPPT
ncbi:MAG: hypothetical protein HC824_16795, partial [Synechococcales cyanobacterium RM1_1_8]|nr:hypothetical protein [Synechococcales cyanobacterium RM1_1_8]